MVAESAVPQMAKEDCHLDNLAAVLHGINDLRVENRPIPMRIPPGHVRIAIKAVGICGSDVHYWKKVCDGDGFQFPEGDSLELALLCSTACLLK